MEPITQDTIAFAEATVDLFQRPMTPEDRAAGIDEIAKRHGQESLAAAWRRIVGTELQGELL